MTLFTLPYGKKQISFELNDQYKADLYLPKLLQPENDAESLLLSAIRNPINNDDALQNVTENTSVAITVNDKTRPVPNHLIFPPLLSVLKEKGIKKENITILIATGTHIPMPEEEHSLLLPKEILRDHRVISHDCDDRANLEYKGKTGAGTPVYVNSIFDKADLKIVVGNIEPHHFAGFSGGAKSASIGVCGRETINHNHALLKHPKSCVGRYEDNPLRQDIEEIGHLIGIDLALNVILNEKKEILHALFGSPIDVMEKGIEIIRKNELVPVLAPYDLVIASAGGYPKDINLYQAQKALTHASLFCKDGGMVLLTVACTEGVGSQTYVDFMQGVSSHQEAKDKFQKMGFKVGPHKSFQFAMIADRVNFQIKSDIKTEIMDQLLIQPINDLQQTINVLLQETLSIKRIAVIPYATATIPQFPGD